jgi:hypothetical protein
VAVLVAGVIIFVGRFCDFGWGVILVAELVAITVALFVYEFIKAGRQ